MVGDGKDEVSRRGKRVFKHGNMLLMYHAVDTIGAYRSGWPKS